MSCQRPGELWTLNYCQKPLKIKKPDILSSKLQKAKVGEIRFLKASMFLAHKYPPRWSADDPVAWRKDSTKEPGRAILIHVFICLNMSSFLQFQQISVFHGSNIPLKIFQSVGMLLSCYNAKSYGWLLSCPCTHLSPPFLCSFFGEFQLIIRIYSGFILCLFFLNIILFDSSLSLSPNFLIQCFARKKIYRLGILVMF